MQDPKQDPDPDPKPTDKLDQDMDKKNSILIYNIARNKYGTVCN